VVEPFVIEGLLGPDGGLNKEFKLVMASLAKVPVGQVKIVPAGNRLFDDLATHIAGKGLHNGAPFRYFIVMYDGSPCGANQPSFTV
jgi:hypothetical protein